ncbi:oligosaccharide flippase family protein [Polaromonas sp.]|uniref:oligosaccharide flippase family protein n=1 Tax=Polaromonas sp. TaxID=1869339 RepID=UPI0013B668FA|nr:oligosaccharide flippase family protein [Polaromonas sp.]NDP61895.1 oligosaccharide flippase family protein [Polaromonas sp.]
MSLKKNVLANYASQIYVTLIGIVMVPLYVKYMGAEAYGLVGFFAMLQAWFQLLDMGLTPTMARETARFNGGASDALSLRRLLRALEGIFIGIAVLGGAAMMSGSGAIATGWLKVQQLPLAEVQHAIMLMAVIIALRWVCGLYRGAINGFERLVWLSGFNITIATARFVLVIPLFMYIGTSPTEFFSYQLVLAVVELVVLVTKTYRLLPKTNAGQRTPWQWAPLRGVLKFSLTIAFTSSVWVLVTQTDKLVLSKLLPLADYAYFTLAVLVASGVMIISGPISGALLPRLTRLAAVGDEAGLIRLYRNATQLVGVIAIPAALVLAFFAEQVLWAWTGDAAIARSAAPVLTLYALGNGILALGAFPYYLQFAKGDLKLHLIGNALFVLLLIPSLVWATWQYGVIGAGYAWLGANSVYFLIWVPKVHRRFVKGLHTQWLLRDLGTTVFLTVAAAALAHGLVTWPHERASLAMGIAFVSLVVVVIAAVGSSWVRATISGRWHARFC